MESVTLSNGTRIPFNGFGVFQIPDLKQCEDAVYNALMAGYRMIDTAAAYCNEEAVGRAIQRSGIPREELFIATKLWVQDAGYESAHRAFKKSLSRLKLDYVDLYMIHQPYSDVYASWRALEEIYEAGSARAIGVSNFSPARLTDLMCFNKIIPMVNQIEVNPLNQQIENIDFMKKNGVHPIAWSPFAQGKHNIFSNNTLTEIAKRKNKNVAQIILRWLFQRGITGLAKSVTPQRILQNIDIFSFELTLAEMNEIKKIDTGKSQLTDHEDPERIRWISTVTYDI